MGLRISEACTPVSAMQRACLVEIHRPRDIIEIIIIRGIVIAHRLGLFFLVDLEQPGTSPEGFETGSAGAAVGGTTTFLDMPLNNDPPTLDADSLAVKVAAVTEHSVVDYGLWGGIVPGNLDDLADLHAGGVVAAKAFMCHSGLDEYPGVDLRLQALDVGLQSAFGGVEGHRIERLSRSYAWTAARATKTAARGAAACAFPRAPNVVRQRELARRATGRASLTHGERVPISAPDPGMGGPRAAAGRSVDARRVGCADGRVVPGDPAVRGFA